MFDEMTTFRVFLFLAAIELGDRTVVSHHAGPDFAGLTFALFELGVGVHRMRFLG